jgi:hypothetical protein
MLQSGMDHFSFSDLTAQLPQRQGPSWMPVWCLAGVLSASVVHAGGPPAGLLVQFRPGVVDTEVDVAPLAARDTPQAQRERALARWQRQHALALRHFDKVAADAGVAFAAVGSAGSLLRVDLPLGSGATTAEYAARRLRLHPDVAAVVPNERLRRAALLPTDPQFAQQWHLQPPSAYAGAINATTGWVRSTGATAPVNVAVVDTGVRFDHPDLSGKLLTGYDFVSEVDYANDGNGRDADATDPGDWVTAGEASQPNFQGCEPEDSSWHGTAIAGVIAAGANNALGGVGVHWGARVVPVRVAGKCGAVLSDLLDGVRWAAGLPVAGVPVNPNPAKIINLSYGGDGPCNAAYQAAIDDATAAGALVVAAAGNAGAPVTRPADCRGVLAVTAVRGDGAKGQLWQLWPCCGLGSTGWVGVGWCGRWHLHHVKHGAAEPHYLQLWAHGGHQFFGTVGRWCGRIGAVHSASVVRRGGVFVVGRPCSATHTAGQSGHLQCPIYQSRCLQLHHPNLWQWAFRCGPGAGCCAGCDSPRASDTNDACYAVHARWRRCPWRPVGSWVVAVVVGCAPQPDQEQACSVLPLRTSAGMSSIKRLKRACRASVASGSLKV